MEKLFSEPLFYIFFVYGVSFMVMAKVIVGGITKAAALTFVSSFYMLTFFGLTHGVTELIDWSRFIIRTLGRGENKFLLYASQTFLVVSFVLLLQFGFNLLTYKSEKKAVMRAIPLALFVVFLAVVFSQRIDDISQVGLISRYSFGFVGSTLAAGTLFRLSNSMKALGNKKLTRGLNVAAASFAVYAVVGGLIVHPLFGIPIQAFRAACAFVAAIASAAILDVFNVQESEVSH